MIPKRKKVHYDIEQIISDLNNLLLAVDYIEEVLLIGGEIFLYPSLNNLICECHKNNKIGKLIITTNGTCLPSDEILQNIKEKNVTIRVSGYSNDITPNRDSIIQFLKNNNVLVEDLENMYWVNIGYNESGNRSKEQLKLIFQTCSMKECISITSNGKMFLCSRQMVADETNFYPDLLNDEYVNIRDRDIKNLKKRIEKFLNLDYISTCKFCDGISCVSKQLIPPAIQILKKSEYLKFLQSYIELENIHNINNKKEVILNIAKNLCANASQLNGIEAVKELFIIVQDLLENNEIIDDNNLKILFLIYHKVFEKITDDYKFKVVSYKDDTSLHDDFHNIPNTITVGLISNQENELIKADILLSIQELDYTIKNIWPIDMYDYNRMYIESKFRLLLKEDVQCIISGLSYTQYGIIEKDMNLKTVNLSITGQDLPYSFLMAEKALSLNSSIKVIVIPIAYYHGFYDMSLDSAEIHKKVMEKVNKPILFEDNTGRDDILNSRTKEKINPIYTHSFDLQNLKEERDNGIIRNLETSEYFSMYLEQPRYGGLKFNYLDLNEDERYISARITANNNERVCTEEGEKVVLNSIHPFILKMQNKKVKVLFFLPPMTKYLQNAYDDKLKFKYNKFVEMLVSYNNCSFLDLSGDLVFNNDDFCDFEHLNGIGGKKLTKLISENVINILDKKG